MELIVKAAGAALGAALLSLVIKKFNPEISGLVSLCAIAVILISALGFVDELKALISGAGRLADISDIYVLSVLKCLGVSVLTRICSDLCKDAGQAALSSTVEFVGCICAAMIVIPLITNMINLVGTMV